MSIASEIQRIKNNIASAYTACTNKGATLPVAQNISNLASTISSISGNTSSKYGLTMDSVFGNVNANGELQAPTSGNLIANGIVRIDNGILAYKFCNYIDTDHYFEDYEIFTNRNLGISSVSFPDLEYVGNYGMTYFINYAPDFTSAEFPKLEEIGNNGLTNAFSNNSNLVNISFPKLKKIGMNGLSSCFYNTKVSIVNFPDLEEVYSGGLSGAFTVCGITSVSMPKLRTAKGSAFSSCFSSVRLLESISFPSLVNINEQYVFHYAFQNCSKMKNIYFPALTPESFGSYKNQFNYMLSVVSGCTVHFPYSIKNTIQDWADITSGFGGSNTSVLFDLRIVYINFITSSNNAVFYINKDLVDGVNGYSSPGDSTYIGHETSTNTIIANKLLNLEENSTTNVNIDFNSGKKRITLVTGVSGLQVEFNINGLIFSATESSSGNYSINIIGQPDSISYFINGGNSYHDVEDSITFNNADITLNINMRSATVKNFTTPTLTANGTLGGNSFAIATNQTGSDGYKMFNGNTATSDYWWFTGGNNGEAIVTFYNPTPIKVTKLVITFNTTSTTYLAKSYVVEGSNDNTNWKQVGSFGYVAGQVRTLDLTNNKAFKYYRIKMNIYSIYLRICEIAITATYKE